MRDIIDEFDFFLCNTAGADTLTPVQGTVRTSLDDTVHLTLHGDTSAEALVVPPDTPLVEVVRLLARRMA